VSWTPRGSHARSYGRLEWGVYRPGVGLSWIEVREVNHDDTVRTRIAIKPEEAHRDAAMLVECANLTAGHPKHASGPEVDPVFVDTPVFDRMTERAKARRKAGKPPLAAPPEWLKKKMVEAGK